MPTRAFPVQPIDNRCDFPDFQFLAISKKSYYENLLIDENLASRQSAVQLLDDLQRLLTERYRSGAASYVEVVRSRVELGRGRSELAAVQQEQIAAWTRLNLLLGRGSNLSLQLSDSLIYAPLTVPRDSVLAQSVRQSNFEQQLRRNFEVAFAAVAAAEKQVLEFRNVVLPESQNAVNAAIAA